MKLQAEQTFAGNNKYGLKCATAGPVNNGPTQRLLHPAYFFLVELSGADCTLCIVPDAEFRFWIETSDVATCDSRQENLSVD